jgi:hypothetical protein
MHLLPELVQFYFETFFDAEHLISAQYAWILASQVQA